MTTMDTDVPVLPAAVVGVPRIAGRDDRYTLTLGCVGNDRRCQAIGLSRAAGGVAKAQTVNPAAPSKNKTPPALEQQR